MDTPSLVANVRREALYAAAMSAGAQFLFADKRHAPDARTHLIRAVSYIRQRLELGSLRPAHANNLFSIARRAGAHDVARGLIDERLRVAPGDLNWLANRVQIEVLAGSYQTTLVAADQVLARQPGDHNVRRYRAEAVLGLHSLLRGKELPDAATVRQALGRPPDEAATEADKLVAGKAAAGEFYNAAYVHALAAEALPPGPQREGQLARALELLAKAKAAGYFGYWLNVDLLRAERGFAALRGRREFEELVPRPDKAR
jgi:hypothetical protein